MVCLGIVMTVGNKSLVGIVPGSVSNSIHGVKEVLPFLIHNHTAQEAAFFEVIVFIFAPPASYIIAHVFCLRIDFIVSLSLYCLVRVLLGFGLDIWRSVEVSNE